LPCWIRVTPLVGHRVGLWLPQILLRVAAWRQMTGLFRPVEAKLPISAGDFSRSLTNPL
jgi:hypothetical protein